MTERSEKLSARTRVLYGSGDLGLSMTSTIIAVLFGMFLTDVVRLRPALAGVAIFIGRTADYLNDPVIGYLSDRTRSRWGRRRPWLLFGAIPFGLSFTAMWAIPPFDSQLALAIYYGGAYVLFDCATTAVGMPYYALTPELTLDYDERTRLTSYRMAFSLVGGLVAFTIPLLLTGTMQPPHAPRVLGMGAAFGVVSAIPFWVVFASTRERAEFADQPEPSLRESLKSAARNKPFRVAAGVFLLTWTTVDIVLTVLLYFIKYRMHLEQHADTITGAIFVTALLSLPFWMRASERWDKSRAYIAGIAFWAAVQIAMVLIEPSWGLPVSIVLSMLAGIGVGAAHVLPWAMLPDAIELDEFETGQRHEGMFYSLVSLAQKVASSIAVPSALWVLDVTGYRADLPVQRPEVVNAVRVLMGPVPAVLLVCAMLFAAANPIDRAKHAEVRAALEARRKAKSLEAA
jgi:GPH family glycoside/pentoside/hexuronide:cation symporter